MIPFGLIFVLSLIGCSILLSWLLAAIQESLFTKKHEWILPLCLLLGVIGGITPWSLLSYDRPVEKEAYYYISSEIDGKTEMITQKIFLTANKFFNMNEVFKCVLPPKTIIRVWNYKPCKNWIRWEDGEGDNHYEMIVPSHVDYEKAKEKLQWQQIVIIKK